MASERLRVVEANGMRLVIANPYREEESRVAFFLDEDRDDPIRVWYFSEAEERLAVVPYGFIVPRHCRRADHIDAEQAAGSDLVEIERLLRLPPSPAPLEGRNDEA